MTVMLMVVALVRVVHMSVMLVVVTLVRVVHVPRLVAVVLVVVALVNLVNVSVMLVVVTLVNFVGSYHKAFLLSVSANLLHKAQYASNEML